MSYYDKYMKYKQKYFALKNQIMGGSTDVYDNISKDTYIKFISSANTNELKLKSHNTLNKYLGKRICVTLDKDENGVSNQYNGTIIGIGIGIEISNYGNIIIENKENYNKEYFYPNNFGDFIVKFDKEIPKYILRFAIKDDTKFQNKPNYTNISVIDPIYWKQFWNFLEDQCLPKLT